MAVKFSKMSGNGNDFIIFDNRKGEAGVLAGSADFVKKICARGLSVGADGVIFIENSDKADFKWQFFNSDGTVAEMCGNGARCAARFAFLEGIAGSLMSFETIAGIIKAEIKDNGEVKAMLTAPHDLKTDMKVLVNGAEYTIHSVNTGVPHAVIFTDNVDNVDVMKSGSAVRYSDTFAPKGTNVNFIEITGADSLKIRTYERGVEGETLACGTGCAASAIIAINKGFINSPVRLLTAGGKTVTVYYENGEVFLQGEGRRVYAGELSPEAYDY